MADTNELIARIDSIKALWLKYSVLTSGDIMWLIKQARTAAEQLATPPADAALADEAAGVVSGLKRANELLRSEGYHPEAFDFSKAAFFIERVAARLRARAVPEGFPRQPNGDGGWVIDANYVAEIRKDCPAEWQPCEEEVEAVLLAVERERALLAASQSATGGA